MVNNIKQLRLKAGLTQKEVSQLTGIRQGKISSYENLHSLDNITIGTLRKIADALCVTINDIVYPLPDESTQKP